MKNNIDINKARGYVEPHNVKSVEVQEQDIHRVIADSKKLHKMCWTKDKYNNGAYAIAHQQITRKPLRFFTLREGITIINPRILKKKKRVKSIEGCMSFPTLGEKKVKRYNKLKVEYRTLQNGEMSEKRIEEIAGKIAFVFQHEIDHFNCKYIFKAE